MEYDLSQLPKDKIYDLVNGLVAPRPIAWITTLDQAGKLDAAPFTARNIRATGEFVINIVNEAVADSMNICAIDFPAEVNKLEIAQVESEPSLIVKVPRIAAAPASLECREITTLEIGRNRVVLGQVVAIHVKDEFLDRAGPFIRAEELHAVGRMNGLGAYVKTKGAFFHIPRLTYEEWKKKNDEQDKAA